jgi:ketosteroid isomerase-like protein
MAAASTEPPARVEVAMFEQLVARTFRPLNRMDLDAWMLAWADDAVFDFPGESAISGHFEGKAEIEAWWRRYFDRMAEISFVPVRVAFGNPFGFSVANTVFTQLTVDMTTKDGQTAHADLVNVSRVRAGKIVEARDYFFDPSVEETLWGRAVDPSGAR